MNLQMYGLDQIAQKLVLVCRTPKSNGTSPTLRDPEVLGQAYKMRTTVAYGLERFWGEHLRLGPNEPEGQYWKDVWDALVEDILQPARIQLPNDSVNITSAPKGRKESNDEKKRREKENIRQIHQMSNKLWSFAQEHPDDQRIALSVLTQLCDCLVWWTQRYKQN